MVHAHAMPSEYADVWGADRPAQNAAFTALMEATNAPVPWVAAVWDDVVANLGHADNHNRAIAAQLLCNLAAHDPTHRILGDLDALVSVTRDRRFVTARHCLQSLWRIGTAGPAERAAIVTAMEGRYRDCATEKNATLIRNDIIEGLRRLFDATGDPRVESSARALIAIEPDPKYRRKYSNHWKTRT